MLDLNVKNLAAVSEAGYEFELLYPGLNEKTGAFVTVRGADSKVIRAYSRKKFTEHQMRQKMDKRKGKDTDDFNIDVAEDTLIEATIERVISWRGLGFDAVEVPFTKENAERVFREHDWIRKQVMEESDNVLNFQ